MPCASTHLYLADRVLDEWRRHPDRSPLPTGSAPGARAARAAFLHGSLAPDMGFIPGCPRLVSELAHYVRPVALTRALIAEAETPEEKAFAWGWAAHVLGDVELHPLVGRAVGERLHGDRSLRVDAIEDVATHVSLEVGLDMVLLREERISRPPLRSFFDPASVNLLGRALGRTYGVDWDGPLLLRSHRRAVTLTRWWPRTLELLARGRWGPRRSRWSMGLPLEVVRRASGAGSAIRGFFGPSRPEPWVLDEVRERGAGFPDRFQRWVDGALSGVPDLNLETGEEAGSGRGHRASDDAERKLARLLRRTDGGAGGQPHGPVSIRPVEASRPRG